MGACVIHVIFLLFYACIKKLHCKFCNRTAFRKSSVHNSAIIFNGCIVHCHSLLSTELKYTKKPRNTTWPKLKWGHLCFHKFTVEILMCMVMGSCCRHSWECCNKRHVHCITFIIFKKLWIPKHIWPLGLHIKDYGPEIYHFDCVWFVWLASFGREGNNPYFFQIFWI